MPNFSKKEEGGKEPVNEIKKESVCDIFTISLDYIGEKYPIKQIESNEKIIITEILDDKNQITIFAKDLETFKVNSKDKNLSNEIKENIRLKCNH